MRLNFSFKVIRYYFLAIATIAVIIILIFSHKIEPKKNEKLVEKSLHKNGGFNKNILEGYLLHNVLNVEEKTAQQIYKSLGINEPIIAMIVNRVDCGVCYNVHVERIRTMMENHSIRVMLLSYNYVEYAQRDFRNKLQLFPPPFVEKFLDSLSENLVLFCMMPNGFVVHADIPNPENLLSSDEFYRQSLAFIQNARKLKQQ